MTSGAISASMMPTVSGGWPSPPGCEFFLSGGLALGCPPGLALEAATGRDWGVRPVGGDPSQRHSGHAHCGDEGQPVSLVAELRMP
jgi:hypothetical protein